MQYNNMEEKKGMKKEIVQLIIRLIVLNNDLVNLSVAFTPYEVFTNCSKCTFLLFFVVSFSCFQVFFILILHPHLCIGINPCKEAKMVLNHSLSIAKLFMLP